MSDYTDIIDYYSLLAMQNPRKAIFHPPAKPPSPAAEAVLNAVTLKRWDVPYEACGQLLEQIQEDVVAALRAAVNQVLPEEQEPRWYEPVRPAQRRRLIRKAFLTIADEIESL